jgi:hypothetical protein
MSETVTATFTGAAGSVLSTAIAFPSGGARAETTSILDAPHHSPARFNMNDPFVLFAIQAGLIILLARILAFFLGKIRQPKVIAEVLAGILLGPSVFGRIPGFTEKVIRSARSCRLLNTRHRSSRRNL